MATLWLKFICFTCIQLDLIGREHDECTMAFISAESGKTPRWFNCKDLLVKSLVLLSVPTPNKRLRGSLAAVV